jgi:two-component system, sensor histidine kinase LadS
MKYKFTAICLFYALILRGSPAQALPWTAERSSLSGYMSILKDEKGTKTIAEILHDSTANQWLPYPSDYLQFGYTQNAIWLRLDIDFDSIPDEKMYWWFDISFPQDVQFYQIEKDSIQKFIHTGINFPFVQRDIQNRQLVFSFLPQKGVKTTLFARIHNDVGSLIGYTYLDSATHFSEFDRQKTNIWLAIFVFMFFAACFSFGLWLAFKEKIYAYYGAYLLCGMMLFISVNGFGYEWFWRNSPIFANASKVVWSFGIMGFLLVFVYRLLFEVVKNHKAFKIAIQLITGFLIGEILFSLNYHYFPLSVLPIMLKLANFTLVSAMFFIFLMLGIGIYKRYSPAYYFLFAFLPVAITVFLVMLRNAGLIHSTSLQSPFLPIPAFCIEIILLFLALLKRFQALLKNQREKLQMELESQIRLQHERERISRDLHDNVGAQLSYIISNIDHIVETQNKDENRLDDVANTAKSAILNLRETIWAINNEQITVEDFYDRFKLYATNQVKNRPDIRLNFSENIVHNPILNPNQALNLYRICQESLNNALKYANARTLDVFIQANDITYFKFCLKDDGIGFDLSHNTEGGYGLKNMKARAREIGADFYLQSELGKGTSVEIVVVNFS